MNIKCGTTNSAPAAKPFKQKSQLMSNEIDELRDAVRYLEFKLVEK